MILAGVDEAGYGPILGPLVVGCSAFDVGDASPDDLPCLWKRLGRAVSRNRLKSGRKLHINDSKIVYAPEDGLAQLERSILALAWARDAADPCEAFDDFLATVAADSLEQIMRSPWYRPQPDDRFPLEQESISVRLMCNALTHAMRQSATRCVHLWAHVLPEHTFNRLVGQTRNKASASFSLVARHLDTLMRNYADQGVVIFCDRQGGREYYGNLLRQMFEDWTMEILVQTEPRSEYILRQGGRWAKIIFAEKAESQCLATAAASMLSKYLREVLMHRFNAYWQRMLPNLQPTAGYHPDGLRFLKDIAPKRAELGISDEMLVRSR
jgi:hypothetical protein